MSDLISDEVKGKAWLIAAALTGSIIGLQAQAEALSRRQQVIYVLSGVATAFFLLPLGAEWFGSKGVEYLSGISFIMGLFWKKVILKCGEVIDIIKMPWGSRE